MLWIIFFGSFVYGLYSLVCAIGNLFECDWKEAGLYGIKIIICVILFFASAFCLGGIIVNSYQETEKTAEYELVSLQDNSQISGFARGGLFYVYASMDTNEVYMYYYKSGDGYRKGKITSENVIIYEQENCTPTIVEYTTYTKVNMNGILEGILTFCKFRDEEISYEFYVPKGTVVQTFSLDLQ